MRKPNTAEERMIEVISAIDTFGGVIIAAKNCVSDSSKTAQIILAALRGTLPYFETPMSVLKRAEREMDLALEALKVAKARALREKANITRGKLWTPPPLGKDGRG